MLIKFSELTKVWKIAPKGVLHIGAHEAEESASYNSHSWGPVIWIEAQSKLGMELSKRFFGTEDRVIHAAIWNENDLEIELKITNNSQSSSLLDLGTHATDYPTIKVTNTETIMTKRIDSILTSNDVFNFVNLDIQGAELHALQGFGDLIESVDYVYTEVNNKEVYVGGAHFSELEKYLNTRGFFCAVVRWIPKKGWGDAIFIRSSICKSIKYKKILSLFYSVEFYGLQYIHLAKSFLT